LRNSFSFAQITQKIAQKNANKWPFRVNPYLQVAIERKSLKKLYWLDRKRLNFGTFSQKMSMTV